MERVFEVITTCEKVRLISSEIQFYELYRPELGYFAVQLI
jgi:hypothetical protein